jgi:glycosyltransferase involved in cell wall biosynthesis
MLTGDAKWGALYGAETFVLTSHQENFGIAVAEALACGKPVLISNQINIWQEIEADKAGLVAEDNERGAQQLFRRWQSLTADEKAKMARAATVCYQNRFDASESAAKLLATMKTLAVKNRNLET